MPRGVLDAAFEATIARPDATRMREQASEAAELSLAAPRLYCMHRQTVSNRYARLNIARPAARSAGAASPGMGVLALLGRLLPVFRPRAPWRLHYWNATLRFGALYCTLVIPCVRRWARR